jgi:hypothetical protein
VEKLEAELFAFLGETGASLPVPDPDYDAEKEEAFLQAVATQRLNALEEQRKRYLSEDFDPGNNWCGIRVTPDWPVVSRSA